MKSKWKMNPILRKELMVGSRSIKMSLAIMAINGFLTLIVILVMLVSAGTSGLASYDYSSLIYLFLVLGCIECGIISLVVPIITSGSISGEREKQTLDIMLTTPIKPFSIAVGKLESAMVVVMMYMISNIPMLAISFVLGGLSWWALLGLIGMMLYLGIYVGSVGIFCSSVVKRSVAATILTIVIGIGIITITALIFGVWNGLATYLGVLKHGTNYNYEMGASLMVMMMNPYAPIFDFMVRTLSSFSVYTMWDSMGNGNMLLKGIYKGWIPISMIVNLAVSFGFLKLAARNIAATRNRKR
ncbi:MAG: ABC transporter permease [Lachnospiraceae bacterium]|nr:ABC transporter permease [Lachnospiraceae bacterium]